MNDKEKNSNIDSFPIIVSNSYIKKYYLDERLNVLPKEIKDTLRDIFENLTKEVGGIVEVHFDTKEYDLLAKIYNDDNDYNFDSINANYKLSKIEREFSELFDKVAQFCKFKFNGLV